MAKQAFLSLAVLLLVYHSVSAFNYSEAHEAKSIVDSLYERLQNELKEYKNSVEKTKEKINETEHHLVIVKKIQVLLGQLNNQQVPKIELPLGEEKRPGDSCKQIHDSKLGDQIKSSAKSGVYWIKTSLKENEATKTFCDMENGGWTLVGKISGRAGNIYSKWLVENVNTEQLLAPEMDTGKAWLSCLDARLLAVQHASDVMFSSGDNPGGIGSKWVQWKLPSGREYSTWWNHGVTQAKVQAADTSQVTVKAWNGNTKVCYQNKYGIMPLQQHGGSYPYASVNRQGNTGVNDYCMAVGVMSAGSSADGWSQNANGFDSPGSDSDWPNNRYNHQSPRVLVWLK